MRREITFLRRGREVRLGDIAPTLTLLDYLRLTEHAVGTKEGCAEGDCGACTVVLRKLVDDRLVYQPVNSCILLAGQADGAEVITVEDLADGAALHPVQQLMVDQHGTQCGFCTPGFIMVLLALYHAERAAPLDRATVNDWIAGNLCRCTGYRPIVDAALASCGGRPADRFAAQEREVARALGALADDDDLFVGSDASFFAAPASVASLAKLYAAHSDAVLVGGATDVGLWITKQLQVLPKIIWLGRVRGLDAIEDAPDAVTFGAMVSHEAAIPSLAAIDPDLGELMRRFAGKQIRTVGTIGGNIANGSPIGDTLPALIAAGATLVLRKGDNERRLPLEDYFLAYGKQDRAPGEFVVRVILPNLPPGALYAAYKVSKRFDQDISAVCAALYVLRDGARVTVARLAFGGMAATPKRATKAEAALTGSNWSEISIRRTMDALAKDFSPLTDQRGSAAYRLEVAQNLLLRFYLESAGGAQTRVLDVAAVDA